MVAGVLKTEPNRQAGTAIEVALGSYAARAESAWMGSVQATEVLDPLRTAPRFHALRRAVTPHWPRWSELLTRELTVAEASFVLMASFFSSALLGAVRQMLFNAQYGVGPAANAYYAAFRLPDTLFSLIAGGALSSAMIPVLLSTHHEDGTGAGMTPSCWSSPSASKLFQLSTILPPAMRLMAIPVTVTRLPVAGMPRSSPRCVPMAVQRVTTLSPSAI